jgi:hypothetical protein
MELDEGGVFTSLASQSGFSVRDCQLAAATGRLAGIVRIAELRKAKARTMYGWEALALVEERIRRENLHRLELLRLKASAPL